MSLEDGERAMSAVERLRATVSVFDSDESDMGDYIYDVDDVRELLALHDEAVRVVQALRSTGLNGGNNVRLALMAASRNVLDAESLAQADASEAAVQQADAFLAKAGGK